MHTTEVVLIPLPLSCYELAHWGIPGPVGTKVELKAWGCSTTDFTSSYMHIFFPTQFTDSLHALRRGILQGNRIRDHNLKLFSLSNYIGFIFSICTMPSSLLMVQTIYFARLEETLKSAAKFKNNKNTASANIHILHIAV